MKRGHWPLAASVVLALVGARHADAYDSRCYVGGESCAEGPQAARGQWIGPSDEHRQLFEQTMDFAGLPAETKTPMRLEIWTDGATLDVAGEEGPSLIPVGFGTVTGTHDRYITVAELSQLPDFGYALFDWATGFETCPVDQVDAVTCHTFAGHMGTLNSNHFLPQAQAFYEYYHELALTRAAECKAMSDALGDEASRFFPVLFDCEKEALGLEAIGQHYLQDAWSSGHMWYRWGSPELADFPSLLRGMAVAATSGIIHGARALLQLEALPDALLDVNDAMCAPHPEVEWRHEELGRHAGVGDLYLGPLLDDANFQEQEDRLFACAVAGVRAVYAATGMQHGPMGSPQGPVVVSLDPLSDDCFGQRVTNRAIKKGFGLDVVLLSGEPRHIAFTPALAGSVLLAGAASQDDSESAVLGAQFGVDLIRLAARLEWYALTDPEGTNMASGHIGSLVGIEPNSTYVANPPASYVDPPLPWQLDPAAPATAPTTALLRAFHRAHAADWCEAFASGAADLADLKARVTVLTTAIDALPPDDPTRAALEADRVGACAVCGEMVGRHVRLGSGPEDYDTDREPLCRLLSNDALVVYAPGEQAESAGARWCGCGVAICDGGFRQEPELLAEGPRDEETAESGPLVRSFSETGQGSGTVTARYGDLGVEITIDVSDQEPPSFSLDGYWDDWVIATPADPSLTRREGLLRAEVEFTRSASATGGEGSVPIIEIYGAVAGLPPFDVAAGAGSLAPSTTTEIVEIPINFGVLRALGGTLRVRGGFAPNEGTDSATGSIRADARIRWVRVAGFTDLDGNPVEASLCSLSGTSW